MTGLGETGFLPFQPLILLVAHNRHVHRSGTYERGARVALTLLATGQILVRGRLLILFGGDNISSTFKDTWVWSGTNWYQQQPVTAPPDRGSSAMAYDPDLRRVVLFWRRQQCGRGLQ